MTDPVTTWLKHLEVNRRYSGHTLSAYRRDLNQLMALADGKPLEQIVNGNIRHFLARLHGQGHSARSLARKAGYTDVRVLRVEENDQGRGFMPVPMAVRSMDVAAEKTTPISPGELSVAASMSFTFEMVK
jgi:hypothetical protein